MKQCNCHACGTEAAVAEEPIERCGCGVSEVHTHEHDHDHEHESGCGNDHGHAGGCGCGHDHSHGDLTTPRQDAVAITLSVLLAVGAYLAPAGLITALLFVAATLVVGFPIFRQGLKNILKLDLEEMTLLTVAVTAAVLIGEYPEALLVTLLFRIGSVLEDVAVRRSQRELDAITRIIPENANLLLDDGTQRQVSARELPLGSTILIKSGERVPVDCEVLSGESSLDTSSLTGESAPREAHPGDLLLSGSVNMAGVLTCRTTSTFDNSTASRIVEMVRESAAKKGTTERLISRFARIYTPIVIGLAVLVAVLPPLLGFGTFTEWIMRSLVFLVASCPCALVISIPVSFFAGIGAASKNGILVKGSRYIEALAKADAVVFDKTGTLTTGELQVSDITPYNGYGEDDVLQLAAGLESFSNHPIARAVVAARKDPLQRLDLQNPEEITSFGVRATLMGEEVLCGSRRMMERCGVDLTGIGSANVYIARGGKVAGTIAVSDIPREDARETVAQLKAMGIRRTAMLTGDEAAAAETIRRAVGVDTAHAELLPQDKVIGLEAVKALNPGKTLFVGDGVNDAPVLARADAGIAMGLGSDSAIEAADVVLMSDKLSSLPQAIRIARKTSRLARFNIAFALTVKLAVFVLAFFGVANMWMAVFADVGVSILSVLNATRALKFK